VPPNANGDLLFSLAEDKYFSQPLARVGEEMDLSVHEVAWKNFDGKNTDGFHPFSDTSG
jgi:hypothetical protein